MHQRVNTGVILSALNILGGAEGTLFSQTRGGASIRPLQVSGGRKRTGGMSGRLLLLHGVGAMQRVSKGILFWAKDMLPISTREVLNYGR